MGKVLKVNKSNLLQLISQPSFEFRISNLNLLLVANKFSPGRFVTFSSSTTNELPRKLKLQTVKISRTLNFLQKYFQTFLGVDNKILWNPLEFFSNVGCRFPRNFSKLSNFLRSRWENFKVGDTNISAKLGSCKIFRGWEFLQSFPWCWRILSRLGIIFARSENNSFQTFHVLTNSTGAADWWAGFPTSANFQHQNFSSTSTTNFVKTKNPNFLWMSTEQTFLREIFSRTKFCKWINKFIITNAQIIPRKFHKPSKLVYAVDRKQPKPFELRTFQIVGKVKIEVNEQSFTNFSAKISRRLLVRGWSDRFRSCGEK